MLHTYFKKKEKQHVHIRTKKSNIRMGNKKTAVYHFRAPGLSCDRYGYRDWHFTLKDQPEQVLSFIEEINEEDIKHHLLNQLRIDGFCYLNGEKVTLQVQGQTYEKAQ